MDVIYTSCYGRLKKIKADPNVHPVAISVGVPRWYKGPAEKRLAPTRAMLKMPPELYNEHYQRILDQLNPFEMVEAVGNGAVLLCWESPDVRCHRRFVAEWIESATGLVVPEYGFQREETPFYKTMPSKLESNRKGRSGGRKGTAPKLNPRQMFLF